MDIPEEWQVMVEHGAALWHPVYSHAIFLDEPYPVFFKGENGKLQMADNYVIKFYSSDEGCRIFHKQGNTPLKPYSGRVILVVNGVNKTCQLPSTILLSAFPTIQPGESVDHINDNPHDHRVTNLQWMSRSENSKKGQAKSANTKRTKSTHGRHVVMLHENEDGNIVEVRRFTSIGDAAELIRLRMDKDADKLDAKAATKRRDVIANRIRDRIKDGLRAYNFYWIDQDEPAIADEVWKPIPEFVTPVQGYSVSNRGRVRNSFGHLSSLVPNRYGKQASVCLGGTRFYVHHLVFWAFNNRKAVGNINHDQSAPLRNGLYRNYLEDLSEGNRSDAMQQFGELRRNGAPVPNETTDEVLDDAVLDVDFIFNRRAHLYGGDVTQDAITEMMKKPPKGIQFSQANGAHGTYYTVVLQGSRAVLGLKAKTVSDRVKFMHAIDYYAQVSGDTTVDWSSLAQCMTDKEKADLVALYKKDKNAINSIMKEMGCFRIPDM